MCKGPGAEGEPELGESEAPPGSEEPDPHPPAPPLLTSDLLLPASQRGVAARTFDYIRDEPGPPSVQPEPVPGSRRGRSGRRGLESRRAADGACASLVSGPGLSSLLTVALLHPVEAAPSPPLWAPGPGPFLS